MSFSGHDETVNCKICKKDFIFSAGQQAHFQREGFAPPKKCKTCKDDEKLRRGQTEGYNSSGGYSSGAGQNPASPIQSTNTAPAVEYRAPKASTKPAQDDWGNEAGGRRDRKDQKRRRRNDDFDY